MLVAFMRIALLLPGRVLRLPVLVLRRHLSGQEQGRKNQNREFHPVVFSDVNGYIFSVGSSYRARVPKNLPEPTV